MCHWQLAASVGVIDTGGQAASGTERVEKGMNMWVISMLAGAIWPDFTSFGAAGMMGAMWLWERKTSRQREEQLDEAHVRILGDRVQLEQLIDVVRRNVEAMTRLGAIQDQLVRKLDREEQRAGRGSG